MVVLIRYLNVRTAGLQLEQQDGTRQRKQAALTRECRSCSPVRFGRSSAGWWKDFGLTKNPYVYGPMPRLRTSRTYRMEEARRMGWMAWTWNDEYAEESKGVTITCLSQSNNLY